MRKWLSTAAQILFVLSAGFYLAQTTTVQGALCAIFTSSLSGCAPASGGGTSNFLRADATWHVPPGTAVPGSPTSSIQYNNSGAFGGVTGASSNGTVITFTNSDLRLLGSSTGYTTFSSNNASATNYTQSFQAATGTTADLDVADQTVSGGANITSTNLGTKSSGTTTIDCGTVQLQYLTNGGAFTLAAPSHDGNCLVLTTNNGSAGTITFSGFSVGSNTGDALDTANGDKFTIFIWRINSVAGYRVAAHQ